VSILTHEPEAAAAALVDVLDELKAGPDVIAPNARRILLCELEARLKEQGVPWQYQAYVCPVCGTVQSIESLFRTDAFESRFHAEPFVGRSCVRAGPRGSAGGPRDPDADPCFGCDWTRGGFLQLCRLVVVDHDGVEHPIFEPATKGAGPSTCRPWSCPRSWSRRG
jgi:hypothetical protein